MLIVIKFVDAIKTSESDSASFLHFLLYAAHRLADQPSQRLAPNPPRVRTPWLTQPLQGAVAVDLRFHGGLVGWRQLGQVVEGVGEGRVAAVVSHAASHDAATQTGTFPAAGEQGGSGGELGRVVHTCSALWRERDAQTGERKVRRQ